MKKSLLKKTLGVMLGSVICISMLAGCGGGDKKAEKPASKFPEKAITVVVPWNPGGTNDLMARALQPVFKSKFKADLVVKNSPGGGSAGSSPRRVTGTFSAAARSATTPSRSSASSKRGRRTPPSA